MTVGPHATSTYDRMLAEIELEGDDAVSGTVWTIPRHVPRPHRAEAKIKEQEREPTIGRVPFDSDKRMPSDDKLRDEQSLSFTSAPHKPRSRRQSTSDNGVKGGDDSDDDNSDEEKETRVRHRGIDAFEDHLQGGERPVDVRHDLGALRVLVSQAPKLGAPVLRCYIERDRHGLNRLNPVYRLYLEDGKHFMLTAQKRSSSKTSNYLLSLSKTPVDRRSNLVVAKLRANWSGSEYTIFDGGLSPRKAGIDESVRKILGLVEVAYDAMGPGRLTVHIPTIHESGRESIKWRDREVDKDDTARKAFESTLNATAFQLRNKRPTYDAASGGHVLDFKGRVNMPSVKNFQMQSVIHGDDTVLQFGRVSCQPPGPHKQCKCHQDTFTMDVQYPLSPVQAFAICLAALDTKVADAKAYESVANLIRRLSS